MNLIFIQAFTANITYDEVIHLTLSDWIYSRYPADSYINGRWGTLHILSLALCVLTILVLTLVFSRKSLKARQNVILVLAALILLFELSRRVINLSRGNNETLNDFLHILLPRPWCAISCWLIMASSIIKKTRFYNFASMNALINAIIFFAYPSVGFNDKYILFENTYSIVTHMLLLITSITLMTLRLTDFTLGKGTVKETIGLGLVFAYAFIEIYLLKIEKDPLYFMPDNEVQAFLGVEYTPFLFIYIGFLAFYFSMFYIGHWLLNRKKK